MTMYEPNSEVRPTGAEIAEFVDVSPADRTPDAPRSDTERDGQVQPAGPYLRIYLNDHRAGATAGVALARRCHGNNPEGPLGDALRTLVEQLVADAAALERIARYLDVPENRAKAFGARVAEIVGRLKTNGRLREYSPLSRLLELEALIAAIDAKRSLWRSLVSGGAAVPPGTDLHALEERASGQREMLTPFHHAAAEVVVG